MRVIDISGQRFGKLVTLERIGLYYHCVCDCGNEKKVLRGNLKQGITKSCGCSYKAAAVKREARKNLERGSTKTVRSKIWYYRRNAKVSKIPFDLTLADFEQILSEPCHYCGTNNRIGIDRIDSSKGYDYSNVLACCFRCNQAKNDQSIEEFKEWAEKLYLHFCKGGL